MTRPPDASPDRRDRPAPRVVRDRAQPAADVDHPPPAGVPDHRTASCLAGVVGERALPPELAAQVLAQRPEWAAFTAAELAGAFAVQQFLAFFLLMPAYIPLSIATFSIIGEKQARTLEPVLATPIRTVELLTAKAIAALVPGVAAGWVTYVVFVALASRGLRPEPVRRRHRLELAGRRLRARAGRRACRRSWRA